MSQQAQDDYYGNAESLALGYAEAVAEEVADLFAAFGMYPVGFYDLRDATAPVPA